jgi:hypothetical protein
MKNILYYCAINPLYKPSPVNELFIEHIIFDDHYNATIDNIQYYKNLKSIKFGKAFDQPITALTSLSKYNLLTSISFGESFSQDLSAIQDLSLQSISFDSPRFIKGFIPLYKSIYTLSKMALSYKTLKLWNYCNFSRMQQIHIKCPNNYSDFTTDDIYELRTLILFAARKVQLSLHSNKPEEQSMQQVQLYGISETFLEQILINDNVSVNDLIELNIIP